MSIDDAWYSNINKRGVVWELIMVLSGGGWWRHWLGWGHVRRCSQGTPGSWAFRSHKEHRHQRWPGEERAGKSRHVLLIREGAFTLLRHLITFWICTGHGKLEKKQNCKSLMMLWKSNKELLSSAIQCCCYCNTHSGRHFFGSER